MSHLIGHARLFAMVSIQGWFIENVRSFHLHAPSTRSQSPTRIIFAITCSIALFCSGLAFATTDTTPPVLVSISVDKTSVDVSSGYQMFTFSLEATDETDSEGFRNAYVWFQNVKPDGSLGSGSRSIQFNTGYNGADANGVYDTSTTVGDESVSQKSNQLVVSSSDFDLWTLNYIYLTDTPGNGKSYYSASLGYGESETMGVVSSDQTNFELLGVLDGTEESANLTLNASLETGD